MKVLPENFIVDENTDFEDVTSKYELSEEFIEKHFDKFNLLCIDSICVSQKLSEGFIEKYFDKLCKINISACQILSEDFIEKYIDKLYLNNISYYQKLSESFIKKYKKRLSSYSLCRNKNVLRSVKRKLNIDYFLIKSRRLFFRKKFLLI